MTKKQKIILTGVFLLFLIIGSVGWYSSTLQKTLYNQKQENSNLKQKLQNTNTTLKNLQVHHQQLQQNLSELEDQITHAQKTKENTYNTYNQTLDEITRIQNSGIINRHDPTYHEAYQFLTQDHTDKKPYQEETYKCSHFSQDVNNHAEQEGIRCAYVEVNLTGEYNHACVCFNTTDRGLVFFEPQSDEKVNIEIGKEYWSDCIVTSPGYYYTSNPNDEITGYILYW